MSGDGPSSLRLVRARESPRRVARNVGRYTDHRKADNVRVAEITWLRRLRGGIAVNRGFYEVSHSQLGEERPLEKKKV